MYIFISLIIVTRAVELAELYLEFKTVTGKVKLLSSLLRPQEGRLELNITNCTSFFNVGLGNMSKNHISVFCIWIKQIK